MNTLKKCLLFALFVAFLSACALLGSGENKIHRAENYHLDIPDSWLQLKNSGESDRAFQLPSGNKLAVTSSCDRNREANLKTLTRQLLIGMRQVKILEETPLAIPNGSGLFTSLQATADGARLILGVAVVKMLGCVFDFSLVSKSPLSSQEKRDFLKFVNSLKYGND